MSEVENEDAEDEGPTAGDEGLAVGNEGPGIRVKSLSLGGDEAVPKGQQWAASVVETTIGEPLRLGYGALRRQEIASREGKMSSVFEVDPKDGRAYIDVPAYSPPAPPIQTPPSPEWSSGLLPISPTPSTIPSPISLPMISLTNPSPVASPAMAKAEGFLTELGAQVKMQGGLIHDHTVQLRELSPALFERYDRDIGELFTIAALWHAIGDTEIENQELRLQITEERHAWLDLVEIVASMRRGQEPRGDV
ncbi:hypothetical protein Tco_0454787 [Tanacetum coccineum]